jgi:hypothetical protein
MRWLAPLILLCGCTNLGDRPRAIFTPQEGDFWRTPWPSDLRRDLDNTIAVSDFPNPHTVPLLIDYIAFVDDLDGFGTNTGIYFPLSGPIDQTMLPTPQGSLSPDAAVLLVDVDPASPWFGEQVPLQWEVLEGDFSAYLPDHLFTVAPVFGFPLRPATEYAAILTTELARPAPGFDALWKPSHADHAHVANLKDVLPFLGLAPSDVAVAAVFTTQDPLQEMAEVTWHARERLEVPDLGLDLEHLYDHDTYTAYRTHYPSPVYTHGERPYQTEGGGFVFDDAGDPVVHSWDDMRLAVCTPTDLSDPPKNGWPVVIFQDGTGSEYRSFCNSDGALEVATQLGSSGLIGLGIDQPLHGTRGEGTDLTNFNLFNADSGVTNFRQGAVDAVYLAHALASKKWTMHTPQGTGVPLNPDRVMFMGHSQGGLTGALGAPFFGDDVHAAVLSGAGGVLAITILERKDIIDFEAMVINVLRIEGETISPLYPVLGLIQTAVEVTDPVNYAPYWNANQGWWPHQGSPSVLLTSGTKDEATPYETAIALASAGQLPMLHPQITESLPHDMRGLRSAPGALSGNTQAWNGETVTSAFSQWRNGSHWVIFERAKAAELYRHYLETAADDTPVAVRPD